MNFGNGVRSEHLLLVAPEWSPGAGADFSAEKYVASLSDSHVNCVEFYVKDHHGISYYDTRVGVRSSYMKGDYLADLCEQAEAHSVEIIAYFSVCWDNYMAAKNPSWLMRTPEGESISVGFWRYLCINTPYRDYMLRQLAEIAKYPVRGFWLDILRFPELIRRGCFCEFCRRKYKEITHGDPPNEFDPSDLNARAYIKFLESSVTSFLREARAVTRGKEVTFNGAGFLTPKAWNDVCDWHNVESHAPEFIDQSFKSRYLASLRKPWEILTPGSNVGWSSWSCKPVDVMQLELAIASSQGGTMTYGTNPDIDGSTDGPRSTIGAQRRAMKTIYGWLNECEGWLKGGRRIANVAILHTLETYEAMMGGHPNPGLDQDVFRAVVEKQPVVDYPREVILEAMGYHKALYDRGFQYEIVNECSLDRLGEFEVLVLPDQRFLSEQTRESICQYVLNGGRIIATNRTSLLDPRGRHLGNFALREIFGVDWVDVSEYTVNYIDPSTPELESGLADHIIPVLQSSLLVAAKESAEVLAQLRFPHSERSETRFYFHEHSGPDLKGPRVYPLITLHRLGKGAVYYVAAPLGLDFYVREDPSVGQIIRNLLLHASSRVVCSETGSGVEINLTFHPLQKHVLVHLVNHYTQRNEAFIPCRVVRGVDLSIEHEFIRKYLGKEVDTIYSIPDKKQIRWKRENGKIHCLIDRLEIYTIIVLQ